MYTPEEIKTAAVEKDVNFIPHHKCGICYCPVGYITHPKTPEVVYFDSRCDCSVYSRPQPSDWDSVAHWINQHTGEELEKYKKLLGLT